MAQPRQSGAEAAQRMLVHAFLGLVAVQFFLAGLGVFRNNPKPGDKIVETSVFDAHRILGDVLTLVALIVLILALVTKRSRDWAGLLFGLMVVQNLLAGFGEDTPFLGGLHAFNALVIVAVAVLLLLRLRPAGAEARPAPAEPRTPA